MKFYSILEGNTQDVLRRFLRLINKSIARIGTVEATVDDLEDDVEALQTLIGDATTPAAGTILARIKALEDAQTPTSTEETPGGS